MFIFLAIHTVPPAISINVIQLLVLQWDKDASNTPTIEIFLDLNPLKVIKEQVHKLSLNAMNNTTLLNSTRFIGPTNSHSVHILLDGSSDNNFIQSLVAKFLQLLNTPTKSFKVLIGNGNSLQMEGLIDNLQVNIQVNLLTFPAYVLQLASTKIIVTFTHYTTFFLKFYHDNEFVTLKEKKHAIP